MGNGDRGSISAHNQHSVRNLAYELSGQNQFREKGGWGKGENVKSGKLKEYRNGSERPKKGGRGL